MTPLGYSIPEAARLLGVSVRTVARLVRQGRLTKIYVSDRRVLIDRESLYRHVGVPAVTPSVPKRRAQRKPGQQAAPLAPGRPWAWV